MGLDTKYAHQDLESFREKKALSLSRSLTKLISPQLQGHALVSYSHQTHAHQPHSTYSEEMPIYH